jgi:hypothetical protein
MYSSVRNVHRCMCVIECRGALKRFLEQSRFAHVIAGHELFTTGKDQARTACGERELSFSTHKYA